MHAVTRSLALCLCAASLLPAQERRSAVAEVIAWGTGLAPDTPKQSCSSAEELRAAVAALGWAGELVSIDFEHRQAVLVALGEGSGGAISVTRVARGPGLLIRIEGEEGARVVADRWAAVALQRHIAPERIAFEWDRPPVHGQPAWVFTAPQGQDLAPVWTGVMKDAVPVQCFTEWAAFTAFRKEHEFDTSPTVPQPPEEIVDFARSIVLVEPIEPFPTAGRFVVPDRIDYYRTAHGAMVRRRCYGNEDSDKPQPRFDQPRFGVYVLPRVRGVLDYDIPVHGRPRTVRRAAQFAIGDPAGAPRLPLLRLAQAEVDERTEALCERATTLAEWRTLRDDLGGRFAQLPDDWCDLARHTIIAVVAPDNHVWAGFELSVGEQDGADVLAALQRGPSGVWAGVRTCAFVVVVPKRTRPLTVVLAERHGPGPVEAKSSRTFPASRDPGR